MGADAAVAVEEAIQSSLKTSDLSGAATRALREFGPNILQYLRVVLRDDGDADEAFSDFGERLWKSIGTFRGESRFRTWAYRLAWNAAQELRRDAFRRRARVLRTSQVSVLVDEVRASTPVHVRSDSRRWLREIKETLELEDRSLLVLRVEQNLSWSEVAKVMVAAGDGSTVDALKKRFERLKTRLRELARER